MKDKKELNTLKNEVDTLNEKPEELTEEELSKVTGGTMTHDKASPQVAMKI